MNDIDTINAFVDCYVAVWNESDPVARRAAVEALWAEDGIEFVGTARHSGHDALTARVTSAYEQLVHEGGFVFQSAGDAVADGETISFRTHMRPAAGGDIAWTGQIMVVLAEDGRIRHDVQLAVATDPTPGTRAVVDEFLRRLVGGDPEHVAELFAEKVDWRLDWPADGHPATPWIRPRSTRAEVAAHFRELAAVHTPHPDPAPGSPPHTVVEGPHAVVLAELRHTAKPTGKPYTAHCAVHITVEAGHITRYHVYEDSLSVAQAHTADA